MNKQNQVDSFVNWIQQYNHLSLHNENDVETKFVIPLFQQLSFPDDCRREKFSIKEYKPGTRGKYPEIDQIYFSVSDPDKQDRDTSLVLIEAKAPKENLKSKDYIEQAYFYGNYLKPLLLVLTNGYDLIVLKRKQLHDEEIIFDNNVESLKSKTDAETFYNQFNFHIVKQIKDNADNLLRHDQYVRLENILSSYPEIQEILEKGDFKPPYSLEGKWLQIVKPKVAIECELPLAFQNGNCRIEFSDITRRGLTIELEHRDILGTLLFGLNTPPEWETRFFLNKLIEIDGYEVRLGKTETVLSEKETQDLCACVDILGGEFKRTITEAENVLESWDYKPTNVEGIPGFRLLSVKKNLWGLMRRFDREHDEIKGNTEWHIFRPGNTSIGIIKYGQEYAVLWPKDYTEIGPTILTNQEIDIICTFSDSDLDIRLPNHMDSKLNINGGLDFNTFEEGTLDSLDEGNIYGWMEYVGPNGIWSAKFIHEWLINKFIPTVLHL